MCITMIACTIFSFQGLKQRVDNAVRKAVSFIETRIFRMADEYALAIGAYALLVADSPYYISALDKLNALAITDGIWKFSHYVVTVSNIIFMEPLVEQFDLCTFSCDYDSQECRTSIVSLTMLYASRLTRGIRVAKTCLSSGFRMGICSSSRRPVF